MTRLLLKLQSVDPLSKRNHISTTMLFLVKNLLNQSIQQQMRDLMPGCKNNQQKPKSKNQKEIQLPLTKNQPKNRSLLMHSVERA